MDRLWCLFGSFVLFVWVWIRWRTSEDAHTFYWRAAPRFRPLTCPRACLASSGAGAPSFFCAYDKCARMFDVAPEARAVARPKVVCPHCAKPSCARCSIPWHEMLSCAEIAAMGTGGGADASADDAYIAATSKPCPNCKFAITHWHGHACHHIMPGSGCPNCGTHFCYSCLRRGKSGGDCGCKLFCNSSDVPANLVMLPYPHDARCGCQICPDCKPDGGKCALCDGTCVVCRSEVVSGPASLAVITLEIVDSDIEMHNLPANAVI